MKKYSLDNPDFKQSAGLIRFIKPTTAVVGFIKLTISDCMV
jgi:hypothetical protein